MQYLTKPVSKTTPVGSRAWRAVPSSRSRQPFPIGRTLSRSAQNDGLGPRGSSPEPEPDATDSGAMFSSLSAISKLQGRASSGSNMLLASDGSEETWRKLDKQVNRYPGQREFKAIGMGGQDFRAAMVHAVESVVGSVHVECVSERVKGRYISVTVGPVWVENGDQVLAIYELMRGDARLRYFI